MSGMRMIIAIHPVWFIRDRLLPIRDDIKILGHVVFLFVCMSVCLYVVGRYQNFDDVPYKPYWVYYCTFLSRLNCKQY